MYTAIQVYPVETCLRCLMEKGWHLGASHSRFLWLLVCECLLRGSLSLNHIFKPCKMKKMVPFPHGSCLLTCLCDPASFPEDSSGGFNIYTDHTSKMLTSVPWPICPPPPSTTTTFSTWAPHCHGNTMMQCMSSSYLSPTTVSASLSRGPLAMIPWLHLVLQSTDTVISVCTSSLVGFHCSTMLKATSLKTSSVFLLFPFSIAWGNYFLAGSNHRLSSYQCLSCWTLQEKIPLAWGWGSR